MNDRSDKATLNALTDQIIAAAVAVHRALGPGLLESAYEACLGYELKKRGYYVLARAQDYFTAYAVGEGAARRDWAQQHADLLVRYIRAIVRGTDWIVRF